MSLHDLPLPIGGTLATMVEATTGVGVKYDNDKPRWDLLCPGLVEEAVDVLTFGAKKYGAWNWQKVSDSENRYFSALIRHIVAYKKGEKIDPESGKSHLAHALCNLMFLYEADSGNFGVDSN